MDIIGPSSPTRFHLLQMKFYNIARRYFIESSCSYSSLNLWDVLQNANPLVSDKKDFLNINYLLVMYFTVSSMNVID